jgi:hypothetical protein
MMPEANALALLLQPPGTREGFARERQERALIEAGEALPAIPRSSARRSTTPTLSASSRSRAVPEMIHPARHVEGAGRRSRTTEPGGAKAKGRGDEIVSNLETVPAQPEPSRRIHLSNHAVEASTTPERALALPSASAR